MGMDEIGSLFPIAFLRLDVTWLGLEQQQQSRSLNI